MRSSMKNIATNITKSCKGITFEKTTTITPIIRCCSFLVMIGVIILLREVTSKAAKDINSIQNTRNVSILMIKY